MVYVSFVLPCRNEEKTIGECIDSIKLVFKKNKIDGEIIVSDSSIDRSTEIAKKKDVHLIEHNLNGYGIACIEGMNVARGKYIFIADADGTYDFEEIPLFLNKIEQGYDIVLGSRLKGKISKDAMPILHRYIGNPILSGLLNIFFKTGISDAHSGFRLIKKSSFKKLDLKTTGMEFASEMIIKAAKMNMKISEIPINYRKRIGESKLSSFSDGWRHLRFMLLFSPTYLFFIPGIFFLTVGFMYLLFDSLNLINIQNQNINLLFTFISSFLTILGYQVLNLGLYSRIYATHTGFETHDDFINIISNKLTLEKSLVIGVSIIIFGFLLLCLSFKIYFI